MGDVRLKGYMTVEASFIIPWVIFLFVFLIYSSFYLYDRCVIFQDSYAYALRAADKRISSDEIKSFLEGNVSDQYGEKYMASRKIAHDFDVSLTSVTVNATGSVHCGFVPGVTLPDIREWGYSAEAKASRISPVEVVRKLRIISDVTEKKEASCTSVGKT